MQKRLVRTGVFLLLVATLTVAAKAVMARVELDERLQAFRAAMPHTLDPVRSVTFVPSDDLIYDRLDELVVDHDVELVDSVLEGDDDASIRGSIQARVARDLAPSQTVRDVDGEGTMVAAPTPRPYTVERVLTVVVRGEGFLVEREMTVEVRRDYGTRYAPQ